MNKIKARRLEMGYTQAHLALRIGSKQQRVYEWEKGIKVPGQHSLTKLAIALYTTVDELITKED